MSCVRPRACRSASSCGQDRSRADRAAILGQMTSAKRPSRANASAQPSVPKPAQRRAPARTAAAAADQKHPSPHDELYALILRYLRRFPNRAVDLTPLADELGMPAAALQVEV